MNGGSGTVASNHSPIVSNPEVVNVIRSPGLNKLLQRMHHSIEEIRILKVGLITRLLVVNRLQSCRERLVPFGCERSYIAENAFHLLEANVAWERDRIQTGAAHRRVCKQ